MKPVITMNEIIALRQKNELISEINTIVGENILYGQTHNREAEEMLLDIINDLQDVEKRLIQEGRIFPCEKVDASHHNKKK